MSNENKIKVATSKMMAYPLDESNPAQYEKMTCDHCGEDYLTQCENQEELYFCPAHKDYVFCATCDKPTDKKTSERGDFSDDYYCDSCKSNAVCIECGESMDIEDSDGRFCSQKCYNDYWADMDEDEHKY